MSYTNQNSDDTRVMSLVLDDSGFEGNAKKSLSIIDRLNGALKESAKKAPGTFAKAFTIGAKEISGLKQVEDAVRGIKQAFSSTSAEVDQFKRQLGKDIYAGVKNTLKATTVDQLSQGWDKYTKKTEAVQTIMASTAKDWADQERQMSYVNAQLEKLNWFTDETSYDFVDMAANIGKFINAGAGLDESVTAMEGISTWAAISGAKVSEASRAMYNLSQAMGMGYVGLADWKSIELANMATMEFKETVLETAANMGTLKKVADGTYKTLDDKETVTAKNMRDSLDKKWFTSDVLVDVLGKYGEFTDVLNKSMERLDTNVSTSKILKWVEEAKNGTLDLSAAAKEAGVPVDKLKQELEILGDSSLDFSRKAFMAAQEAKTFEDAINATKDAASSAWMNIFETLFGNYLNQKGFWTDLAEQMYTSLVKPVADLGDMVDEAFGKEAIIGKKEYSLLGDAFQSSEMKQKIIDVAKEFGYITDDMDINAKNFEETLEDGWFTSELFSRMFEFKDGVLDFSEATKTGIKDVRDFRKEAERLRIDEVLGGDPNAWNYDFAGMGFSEADRAVYIGAITEQYEALKAVEGENAKITDEILDYADAMLLKSQGLADGSVEDAKRVIEQLNLEGSAYKNLSQEVEGFGRVVTDENGDKILAEMETGYYWAQTLKNVVSTLASILDVVGQSFTEAFGGVTQGGVRDIVLTIYDAVNRLKHFVETSEELRAVLTAIFSFFKIKGTILKSIITGVFQVLDAIFGLFNKEGSKSESVITRVANSVTKFSKWFTENNPIAAVFTFIAERITAAGNAVKDFFGTFDKSGKTLGALKTLKDGIVSFATKPMAFLSGLSKKFAEFWDKIKSFKGIDFGNPFSIFEAFRDTVGEYIANFDGFKILSDGFAKLKTAIHDTLENAGFDADKIFGVFDTIGTIGSTALQVLYKAAKLAFNAVRNLFQILSESEFVTTNLTRFKDAFLYLGERLLPFFDNIGQAFSDFRDRVKALDGITLQNLPDVFSAFYDTVISTFLNFDGFDKFKEAFFGLFGDINDKLKAFGIDIPAIFDGIVSPFEEFWKRVSELDGGFSLENAMNVLLAFKETVIDAFTGSSLFQAVLDGLNFAKDSVIDWFNSIGIDIEGIFSIVKGVFDEIIGFVNGIKFPNVFDMLFGKPGSTSSGSAEAEQRASGIGSILGSLFGVVDVYADDIETSSVKTEKGLGGIWNAISTFVNNVRAKIAEAGPVLESVRPWLAPLSAVLKVFLLFKGVKIIGKAVSKVAKSITGFVGSIKGLVLQYKKMQLALAKAEIAVKKSEKFRNMMVGLLAIGAAILAVAGALKVLESIDTSKLPQIIGLLILVVGSIIGLMAVANKFKFAGRAGAGILAMVASMFLLVGLIELISVVPLAGNVLNVIAWLVAIVGALGLAFLATRAAGKNADKAGKGALGMAAAMLILTAVVAILSNLDMKDKWLKTILLLAMMVGALYVLMKNASDMNWSSVAALAMIGAILLELSILIGLLCLVPWNRLLAASGSIAAVFLSIGWMFKQIGSLADEEKKIKKSVLAAIALCGLIIGEIGLMLYSLISLNPEHGWKTILAVTALFGVMALMFKAIAGVARAMNEGNSKGVIGVLWSVAGAIAVIGTVLGLLNRFGGDMGRMTQIAILLGAALGAVILAMWAIAKISTMSATVTAALPALGMVLSAIAAVGLIFALMNHFGGDLDRMIDIAILLGLSLAAVLGAMTVLGLIAGLAGAAAAAIPALTMVLVSVGIIALILGLLSNFGGDNLLDSAKALGLGLLELLGAALILAAIGALSAPVLMGGVVLLGIMAVIGILGLINEWLQGGPLDSIQEGAKLLGAVGEAIGEFIGGIIEGVIYKFAEALPKIADFLNEFTDAISDLDADEFNKGIQAVQDMASAMTAAGGASLANSFQDFIDNFFNWGDEGDIFDHFKERAEKLADALVTFSDKMGEIGSLSIPSDEINALSEAMKNLPFNSGGILSVFTGNDAPTEAQVESFGTMGTLLAGALCKFNEALPEDMDPDRIMAAGTMLQAIAQIIPWLMQLTSTSQYGNLNDLFTDRGVIEAFEKIGEAFEKLSNANVNDANLQSIADSGETVKGMFASLEGIKMPGGDFGNPTKTSTILGNISEFIGKMIEAGDADLSGADKLAAACELLTGLTLEGDLTDEEKMRAFTDAVDDLSSAFEDITKSYNRGAKKLNSGGGKSLGDEFIEQFGDIENLNLKEKGEEAVGDLVSGIKEKIGVGSESGDGLINDLMGKLDVDSMFGEGGIDGLKNKLFESFGVKEGEEGGLINSLLGHIDIDSVAGEGGLDGIKSAFIGEGGLDSVITQVGESIGGTTGEGGLNGLLAGLGVSLGEGGIFSEGSMDYSGLSGLKEQLDGLSNGDYGVDLVYDGSNPLADFSSQYGLNYDPTNYATSVINADLDLSPVTSAVDGLKASNELGFGEVKKALDTLSGDIVDLASAVNTMQLILDTGTLVGEITPMVNREMGGLLAQG